MMQKHSISSSPVYIKLTEFFFKCIKTSVDYTIAKVLIKKINEFPDIYIEEVAFMANTTPASVTKFCKKIGYASFIEMRTDLTPYSVSSPFLTDKENQCQQIIVENMLLEEVALTRKIYELIDFDQCYRIAEKLSLAAEVAVFCNTYSFAAANTLRELLSQYGIVVFEMNRRADPLVILEMLQEVDSCFIICLTGQWLNEKLEIMEAIRESDTHIFLLTSQREYQFSKVFEEIIFLDDFNFLFYSNYYSQKVIHTILKVIANNVVLF